MVSIGSFAQSLDYIWAKKSGGTYTESGNAVATDAIGHVIVAGTFYSSSITFDNITLSKSDSSAASMFVAKYNPDGSIIWAKRASTPSSNMETYGYAVVTDINGNVYVSGDLVGDTISFDNQMIVLPEPYNQASFLVKYDASGSFVWAKMGLNGRGAKSVAIDANGNLLVSGTFNNEINFDNNLLISTGACYGVFLAKYSNSGNFIWANATHYSFAGNGTPDAMSNGICTDDNSNVYLTGFFGSDTVFFDDSNDIYVTNTESVRNVFLAKYNPDGNALWARGATSKPSLFRLSGNCITAMGDQVYLAGEFEGDSVRFGDNFITKTNEPSELFITKYDHLGNNLWANSLGTESVDYGNALATDIAGNVYLGATINGEYFQVNSTPMDTIVGGNNGALVKFDEEGHFLLLKTPLNIPSGQSTALSLVIDGEDDIFVTSGFSNTVVFGRDSLTSINFREDIYVCKLNSTTIGLQEVEAGHSHLKMFPNPAADFVVIEPTGDLDNTLDVKIYDLKGVLVCTEILSPNSTIINTSKLDNGIYVLKVSMNGHFDLRKLIIQR